jgi:hypothetical protein
MKRFSVMLGLCLLFTACTATNQNAYQEGVQAGLKLAQQTQLGAPPPAPTPTVPTPPPATKVALGMSPSEVQRIVTRAPHVRKAEGLVEMWGYYVSNDEIYVLLFVNNVLVAKEQTTLAEIEAWERGHSQKY